MVLCRFVFILRFNEKVIFNFLKRNLFGEDKFPTDFSNYDL
jgi:hypothetical protein